MPATYARYSVYIHFVNKTSKEPLKVANKYCTAITITVILGTGTNSIHTLVGNEIGSTS